MKKLIIAEKPSVASDIAKVLGKAKKTEDWFENDEYVITSALGHLVELFMPDDIDKKFSRWTLKDLPIIPEKFQLKPIEKTKAKLATLKKLLNRDDVDCVINACDAGREGELIFTYIYEITKCKKPRTRLWFSSMTPTAIRAAFDDLREQDTMVPLQDAARCRSESDWLVGINGTRAITSRISGSRKKTVMSVGRVQTPTLAMIVDREHEIENFKTADYWRLIARFGVQEGSYEGAYQRPDYKADKRENDKSDRIWSLEDAQKVLEDTLRAGTAQVSDKKTLSKQIAPRLYDLTTLQREANNRFSLPAGRTLSIAQSLYEKHKMITYPRTDSRALPEDYRSVCERTMLGLDEPYARFAKKAVDEGYIGKIGKRVFDNAQVSDHFAIIPTEIGGGGKLTDDEQKIYDMIARRFVAAFYPEALFDVTVRTSVVAEHTFKTEGKVMRFAGWLDVYGKDTTQGEKPEGAAANLPALKDNENSAKIENADLKQEQTKPPARYTEATLLSAMEGAGKLVEDEDLALAMKEKGLGTPATRAQIIETLINHKFVERAKRDLIPTALADSLITFLRAVGAEEITSPSMTGEWEFKLKQIEKNKLSRDVFMNGISEMTTGLVEKTRNFNESQTDSKTTDIISPTDGKPFLESFRAYRSQDGAIVVYKTMGNRKLSTEEVRALIADKKIGPLSGFKSKLGRPYSASLKLDEANKVKFVFENSQGGEDENGAPRAESGPEDLSAAPVVCECPRYAKGFCNCKDARVVEGARAYQCFSPSDPQKACSFRIYKTMLSHKITHEELQSLAKTGKTTLIEDFVSNRTKKKFSAFLILNEKGDIAFEFQKKLKGAKKQDEREAAPAKA